MVMEACFQPHSKSHKHRIRGTYYHDDIHVNRAVYKPTQMQKTEFWTPLKIWIIENEMRMQLTRMFAKCCASQIIYGAIISRKLFTLETACRFCS